MAERLWLLRPIGYPNETDDGPWVPWYDKVFGFVVEAETEERAREMADANAGDENWGFTRGDLATRKRAPWLNREWSTCVELAATGEQRIIMKDFAAA